MNYLNLKNLILISFLCHFFSGIFSSGFHHFDEHFQINEFLAFKLGLTEKEYLPWEFHENMRPWPQVFFYYLFAAPLNYLKASPFFIATFLRTLTSLLAVLSTISLLPNLRQLFRSNELKVKWSFLLLNFSWFSLYIHSRASSENLAAITFIFALSLIFRKKASFQVLSGFLIGLSFLSRYQMAISGIALLLWILIYKKHFKQFLYICLGGILSLILGVFIDFWGQGSWNFNFWNYFYQNIVLDKASSFGVSPWWFYFKYAFTRGIPPISLIYILSTLYFWYKKPKSYLTWVTLPFFIIHSLIGHKELRFIFPLILICPIFVVYAFDEVKENKYFIKFLKFTGAFSLIISLIVIFRAANPSVKFYKFIADNKIKEITHFSENPYQMVGLKINFYNPQRTKIYHKTQKDFSKEGYYFFNRGHHVFEMEKVKNCKLLYLTYPKWTLNFNYFNWLSRSRVWSLFRCSVPSK